MFFKQINLNICNFSFYSLEDVNLEWPKNLARMVAEKNDGTKLIHMTNLACHQENARKISKVLAMQVNCQLKMHSNIFFSAYIYSFIVCFSVLI